MSNASQKPLPPFPKEKHWLFGSAYLLRDNAYEAINTFSGKYGPIFSLTVPFAKIVVANRPDFAKYVLLENSKNYTKSMAYDLLRVLLGNGLLTSEGDFWKQQRKLIQPAFHRNKLQEFVRVMQTQTQSALQRFERYAEEGTSLDITPDMTYLTLDIITQAMFSSAVDEKSVQVAKQITLLNQYAVEKLNRPLLRVSVIPTPFNRREQKAIDGLDKVVYEIIEERKKSGEHKDDLLSMLMDARDEETGEAMNLQQLRDEVMTIFVAGNETTANAMCWFFYLLAQNPDAERDLIDEIDAKYSGQQLTFEELAGFTYTRSCIEEAMRIYPPAWTVGRRTIAEDEIGGYRIRPYTNVLVPIILFHRNPEFWDEPMRFKPERFSPDKRGSIDRFTYMPFGGGPRTCIGNHFAMMEMQVIAILFYKQLRMRVQEGFIAQADPLITLRSKNGMCMKVVKR